MQYKYLTNFFMLVLSLLRFLVIHEWWYSCGITLARLNTVAVILYPCEVVFSCYTVGKLQECKDLPLLGYTDGGVRSMLYFEENIILFLSCMIALIVLNVVSQAFSQFQPAAGR